MEDCSNQETVTITREFYSELLRDQRFLQALQAAGVDNWGGYEHAQELMGDD